MFIDSISYPSENQIVFRDVGIVANQLSFLHVKAELDLRPLFENIQVFNNTLNFLIKKESELYKQKSGNNDVPGDDENFNAGFTSTTTTTTSRPVPSIIKDLVSDRHQAGWEAHQKKYATAHTDSIFVLKEMRKGLQTAWIDFLDIIVTLPQTEGSTILSKSLFHNRFRKDLHREERDIASALLFGLPGTIMGIMNQVQILGLKSEINSMGNKVNNLVDITEGNTKALEKLSIDNKLLRETIGFLIYSTSSSVKLQAKCANFFRYIDGVFNRLAMSVESAQNHRMSIRAINGQVLLDLFKYLKVKAEAGNYDLFLDHPSDLYQIDASFLYDSERFIFTLVLHVPMVPALHQLVLQKFLPFPIMESSVRNHTIIPNVGEHVYLALNKENDYRIMSQADLGACIERGTLYLCLGRNSLRSDLMKTCIGGMYLKDAAIIKKNCQFNLLPPSEQAVAINRDEWLISSPQAQSTATIHCDPTGKGIGGGVVIPLRAQTRIKLKPGCSLRLKENLLTSDFSDNINFGTYLFDWKFNDSLFSFASLLPEEVARKVDELKSLGVELFKAQDLQHLKVKTSMQLWDYVCYAAIGLVIFGVVLGFLWFFCFRQKNKTRGGTGININLGDRKSGDAEAGPDGDLRPLLPRSKVKRVFGRRKGKPLMNKKKKLSKPLPEISQPSSDPPSYETTVSQNPFSSTRTSMAQAHQRPVINSIEYAYVDERLNPPSKKAIAQFKTYPLKK